MKIGDIMQKFFMSNPKRAMWFMSTMPASFWQKKGRQKALATFHEAAKKVPAYKNFLRDYKIKAEDIKTFEDFQEKVPVSNKKNYIAKYNLGERCFGEISTMSTVAMSSGTSGNSVFWPRLAKQDAMLPSYFENFYLQNWDIDKKSTLIVVTMALGTWIAGMLVAGATKPIADSGKYHLTLATPGSDIEQIVKIVKGIGANYDQIIIVVYPSLLMPILETGEKENINWKKLNIKLWIGGEAISTTWREKVRKRLGATVNDLSFMAGVYGTADAGGIAFSSPFSSLITNLASKNEGLAKDLFQSKIIPTLAQFSPLGYFIEEKDGELIINYTSGAPLIRYNIHDQGGIISYEKVLKILKNHGYDAEKILSKKGYPKNKIWKWPFVYVYFRKSAISIASANIFPEQLGDIIIKSPEFNSFKLSKIEDEKGNARFVIYLEIKKESTLPLEKIPRISQKYHDIILDHLLKINFDFRQAYSEDPKSCDPLIVIQSFRTGPFVEDAKRTKPKIII